MSKLRVIYWGSGEIGIPTLDMLAASSSDFELCAIITREDAPAGRSMQLCCTPIKEHALNKLPSDKSVFAMCSLSQLTELSSNHIPLITPKCIKGNKEFRKILSALNADAFVVISYGHLLTNLTLNKTKWSICVHTSALPKLRGPSPVRTALALGFTQTEICTFLMTPQMDDGDVILRKKINISDETYFPNLCSYFAMSTPDLVYESLIGLMKDTVRLEPQSHSQATFTRLINKSDSWINWNDDAKNIRNLARALTPDLCISTTFRSKRIKFDVPIEIMETQSGKHSPGELISLEKGGKLKVACGNNGLIIDRIQLESKPWMKAMDFINGFAPKPGEEFLTQHYLIEERYPFESQTPFSNNKYSSKPIEKTEMKND